MISLGSSHLLSFLPGKQRMLVLILKRASCLAPLLLLISGAGLHSLPSLIAQEEIQRADTAPGTVDFASEVAPIFIAHCIDCHQPGIEKGGVSLSTIEDLREGYLDEANPSDSHLLSLVTAQEEAAPEMPKEGEALSAEQVDTLRRWLEAGSPWPANMQLRPASKSGASWWAWQPLEDVVHPTEKPSWTPAEVAQQIDKFIDQRLAQEGLARNQLADRRSLIRRASFDLTGLPPTPEEVEAFIADDSPQAYSQLVDRLLASPAYGERWGRHWLDVVRFGESNGFERNVIIPNLWPFRDYVIRSINQDKPFDRFIQEHIAGDQLAPDDPQSTIGTAFLVAGPYDNVGNQDAKQKAQIRANTLDEMIRSTGEAFLGLTLGCARCHDHKFDPLTQEDYYGIYATYAGVRHGSAEWVSPEQRLQRAEQLEPLNVEKKKLSDQLQALDAEVLERGRSKIEAYQAKWTREPIQRTGTTEEFADVDAQYVRIVCEAKDTNLTQSSGFGIEEFEIYSADDPERNLALATHGSSASGKARDIQDFPDAYGPQLAIDGQTGRRFIAASNELVIRLPAVNSINRVRFSSCTPDQPEEHSKFTFVAEYRIETSLDGMTWTEVANSHDRQPIPHRGGPTQHADYRIMRFEWTDEERATKAQLQRELRALDKAIADVKPLRKAWIGFRKASDAKGPFHVFYGGSPEKKGPEVTSRSIAIVDQQSQSSSLGFQAQADLPEGERRLALARWITQAENPLTPRVLANRVWAYHFGVGIVETPNDFGYMGGEPSHPELLDFLASRLLESEWRLKPLHRAIMLSETYRQSSTFKAPAAAKDRQARWLWRFPPRRLSAEEIRDSLLMISGLWKPDLKAPLVPDGGPGFRLYEYLQDNVATYVPLDRHGPETYRRAVYHQNARASVIDLMTEFDQPDCAFSAARRVNTTTPLQALTMMNHQFTLDVAVALTQRISEEVGDDPDQQLERLFQLAFGRSITKDERADCQAFLAQETFAKLCRAVLNTHELIYVD